jgi:hypothetical protein
MFHIELVEARGGIKMTIEGRFTSHDAEEAKQLIARRKTPAELTVDISEITFVDAVGETILLWMWLIGAKFVAESSYSLHLCKRLHLPLTSNHAGLAATFAGAEVW